MSRESDFDEEWKKLREERAAARRRMMCALEDLEERAKDPLGVKRLLHDHPYVVAGAGAGLGALLLKALFGGHKDAEKPAAKQDDQVAEESTSSSFLRAVKRAAVGIAVPWITRKVAEKVATHFAAAHAEGGGTPPDAA